MPPPTITNPKFDAMLVRAQQLIGAGKHQDAVDLLEKLHKLNIKGKRRDALTRWLGYALTRNMQFRRASRFLNVTWAKAPWDTEIGMCLAMCMLQLGQLEEGLEITRAASKLDPNKPQLIGLMMDILTRMRLPFEALEVVDAARARGIHDPILALRLSDIAVKTDRVDDAIAWLTESVQGLDHNAESTNIHFALGNLYDTVGRYDEAFESYANGNGTRDAQYLPDKVELIAQSIIESYTADKIRSLSARGQRDERPVFIVGLPRSGTTLTEQVIAGHPLVTAMGESQGMKMVNNHGCDVLGRRVHEVVDQITGPMIAEFAQIYLGVIDNRGGRGAVRFTDKMPANIWHAGLIASILPDARFIYVRRDPRDTCLSCFFRNFLLDHAYTTRLDWCIRAWQTTENIAAHMRGVFDELGQPERWMTLRYEELVANPETVARQLIDFIGLEWDESCLTIEADQRNVSTLGTSQIGRKIDNKSAGRWKNYARHLGPLFEALGDEYRPGGSGT